MDFPWIIFLATVILVLIKTIHSAKRNERLTRAQLPQGLLGWPLIGETLEFVSSAYSSRPENFMNKRRLRYGKVFKSHLFGNPTIVSIDAEVSKYILQNGADLFVPSYPTSLTELVGKSSILLINGSLQRRMHGLIGAFFKSPNLKDQITRDMVKELQELMASWTDGHLVYIQDETKHMVFQIMVKWLTGLKPGEEMHFLSQQFQEFIAGLMSLPIKLPGSRLYASLQAKKRMVKLVKNIIQEKRRKNNDCSTRDVIDVFLNNSSDELTDDLIADNVIDLMIPGEDSVPVLIMLAVKYISGCPLALQHLEEENMQMRERKALQGEHLQWTDYMSMPFTQNVLTETLRLGNIIFGVMRKATKDVEINGHFIPKDWCVFTYFRSIHLDDDLYEDPYKFNPWRWKDKDISSCSFTPFGGGPRLCPGHDLARLQASIFLHYLVTGFTWVAKEDYVINFPTVRMKGRMPIWVTRKKDNLLYLQLTTNGGKQAGRRK